MMSEETRKLILRGETKYLEQTIERTRVNGYIDDVHTEIEEVGEKLVKKTYIRVYDISTKNNADISDRLFHYGTSFESLRWTRNIKIEFDGTVYQLDKCKGKNDQKPGPKVVLEVRNPRNIVILERETSNQYREKTRRKKVRWKEGVTRKERRDEVRKLEKEFQDDVPVDEMDYRRAMKSEWGRLRRRKKYASAKDIEERVRDRRA